jgi:hypothetical protein
LKSQETQTQCHNVTSQKTGNLSNTAVENSNIANKYSVKEDVGFKKTENYRQFIYMK